MHNSLEKHTLYRDKGCGHVPYTLNRSHLMKTSMMRWVSIHTGTPRRINMAPHPETGKLPLMGHHSNPLKKTGPPPPPPPPDGPNKLLKQCRSRTERPMTGWGDSQGKVLNAELHRKLQSRLRQPVCWRLTRPSLKDMLLWHQMMTQDLQAGHAVWGCWCMGQRIRMEDGITEQTQCLDTCACSSVPASQKNVGSWPYFLRKHNEKGKVIRNKVWVVSQRILTSWKVLTTWHYTCSCSDGVYHTILH